MNSKPHLISPVIRVLFGITLISYLSYYVWNDLFFSYWDNLNWGWCFISAICILISTIIGIFNIYLLLPNEDKIPLQRLTPAYWFAWAFGLIIPGQIGDVVALSTWLRRHGLEWHLSISRVFLDKLISLLVVVTYAVLGSILIFDINYIFQTKMIYIFIGGIILVSLLFLFRIPLNKILTHKNVFADSLQSLLTTIIQSPGIVIINIILSFIKFSFIGAAYWSVFHAIGITNLEITSVIMLVAASSLVAYLPISFNGLGTVEVTGILLFSTLNIPSEAVISVYLCLRLSVLCLAWLPVIFWYVFYQKI